VSSLEIDVEDVAEIGLKFASGAVGGVHVNYFQRPPIHKLEIVGTQGTLRWDNADGVLHHFKMPAEFGTYSANPPAPVIESFNLPEDFDRNHLFISQTKHFIDVVNGAQPICDLNDGIQALRLALGAKESQSTGRSVVF
jgi:predicted dehydrogenase